MYADYTGNTSLFAGYVGVNYDSSADYWKLMDDGFLAYDGNVNLKRLRMANIWRNDI